METRKVLVVIVWSPTPGALERKVLLLHYLPEHGAYWQPVTGKVEAGESYAEAALREAREETGLDFGREAQYLGLEVEFASRWGGMARERAFLLTLPGGDAPPEPRLDGREHDAFTWLDPGEAAARVRWPSNAEAIRRAALGPSPLLLSARGVFFQDGEEISHARTVELLHRSLVREADGSFRVRIGDEALDVVLEAGVARFVTAYDRARGELLLSGGNRELLDPASLRVMPDNSLRCRLTSGWEAGFLPSAYYEISKDIREGSAQGEFVLNFLGREHRLFIP